MKSFLKKQVIRVLGYEQYLLLLARFNLMRLRMPIQYESAFRHFITLLPAEGLVLDIGANLGVMSAYMAKTYPHLSIMAIEPIPVHCRVIQQLCAKAIPQQINVIETAVGNHAGSLNMCVPFVNGLSMHGWGYVVDKMEQLNMVDIFEVSVAQLDQLPALQEVPTISAIKMDVENYEWEVLQGAQKLLSLHRPLVFAELWNNTKKQQCIALMQSIGYAVHVWNGTKLVPYEGQDLLDYFFLPPKHD